MSSLYLLDPWGIEQKEIDRWNDDGGWQGNKERYKVAQGLAKRSLRVYQEAYTNWTKANMVSKRLGPYPEGKIK